MYTNINLYQTASFFLNTFDVKPDERKLFIQCSTKIQRSVISCIHMKNIILQAQYKNAYNRVFISGFGLLVLATLYFFGFREIGELAVGKNIFVGFCILNFVIGLLRLLLGALRDRLPRVMYLRSYYALISAGSLAWAVSGLYLYSHSLELNSSQEPFESLVKIQLFMIIGVLNSIPQFFRHAKITFLANQIFLYLGLLFLLPIYFSTGQTIVYAGLIIVLFAVVITPQYLKNWKSEVQLMTQEKELQEIIDGFPGAFSEIENGKYKRINRYIREKMFSSKQHQSEWQNMPVGFLQKDQEWIELVEGFAASEKKEQTVEYQFKTASGKKTFLSAFSKIGKNTTIIASIDIQNLVEARRELEVQKLQALEKARLASLGLMAGGIAHEINNPLSVIQSRSDMALRLLQKVEVPEVRKATESLEKISAMVGRISKIIQSMQSLTRETSREDKEVFTLSSLAEEILVLVEEKLRSSGITLDFGGEATFSKLYGNKVELSQVFINAINNSIQAIANLDQKWIRVSANLISPQEIRIQIQDSGLGIPEEVRDKIMTPLFTTKSNGEGTGLGLALSKKIVELHQGKFYFDHEVKHTTLIIELPISA